MLARFYYDTVVVKRVHLHYKGLDIDGNRKPDVSIRK